MRKKIAVYFSCVLILNMTFITLSHATGLAVRCSVYSTNRSSISVLGTGITGNNYVIVASGDKAFKSPVKQTRLNGTQVFNFDSSLIAVSAGATAIPVNFIQGLRVDGYLRQAGTHKLIGAVAAPCAIR